MTPLLRSRTTVLLIECAIALAILRPVITLAKGTSGSAYVPLDSWVYIAFDRLAGMGALDTRYAGLRPWTRLQCAEFTMEAEEKLAVSGVRNQVALALTDSLKQEFRDDVDTLEGESAAQARVESIYTRAAGITGTPLRDGFHYAQTLANDFGRPFNTGFNNSTGFSAEVSGGRFFAYVRNEYQHSPASAGLSPAQQDYFERADGTPSLPYSQATGTVDQSHLLDAYVGVRLSVFDLTAGKQSLWWGPGTMGGMLYSDNIDPVPMVKVDQVKPLVLPSVLKCLGPIRVQAFLGRLEGYYYPRGPYIHGEKIMAKPSPNLEIGWARTAIAFGQGIPFTFRNLIATYFSVSDVGSNPNPRDYPGKRFGGLDFSYRLPYLRDWLTLYTDNITSDDVNPLVNPSRASYNPGLYLSHVPRLSKFDLRFELANSRTRGSPYSSFFYKEGYTNEGFLIGNTVGRRGAAFDASSTCWFSPRRRVQVGWRKETVSKSLVPSGGSQDSVRVEADWFVRCQIEFSILAQHERWAFPFLANVPQSDNVFSLQFTVYPKKLLSHTALRDSN